MDTDAVERLEYLLKENACSGLDLDNSLLQLLFHDRRLIVYCAWRLVSEGEIVAASGSELEAAALLTGKQVDKVVLHPPFHDLDLYFSGGVLLQMFSDSWKYEH